jgi:hypothetical protein
MPQFDSGAAEPIGRFSEGLLLRLLQLNLQPSKPFGQRQPYARRRRLASLKA